MTQVPHSSASFVGSTTNSAAQALLSVFLSVSLHSFHVNRSSTSYIAQILSSCHCRCAPRKPRFNDSLLLTSLAPATAQPTSESDPACPGFGHITRGSHLLLSQPSLFQSIAFRLFSASLAAVPPRVLCSYARESLALVSWPAVFSHLLSL